MARFGTITVAATGLVVACGLGLGCSDDSGTDDGDGGGGSGGGGGTCGDPTVMEQYSNCRAANDQTSCEAAGGTWSTVGLSPDEMCVCPTGQGNCVCTRSTQCLAPCTAPPSSGAMECDGVTQGTCAAAAPFAGCYCWFDENGNVEGRCLD